MQTLIVIIIVALAAIYLGRRFYRSIKAPQNSACSCGCDACAETTTCDQPPVSITDRPDAN